MYVLAVSIGPSALVVMPAGLEPTIFGVRFDLLFTAPWYWNSIRNCSGIEINDAI